jgi:hypothetical protein
MYQGREAHTFPFPCHPSHGSYLTTFDHPRVMFFTRTPKRWNTRWKIFRQDHETHSWTGYRRAGAIGGVYKLVNRWLYGTGMVVVIETEWAFALLPLFFFWCLLGARGSSQSFTLSSNLFFGFCLRKYLVLSARLTIFRNWTWNHTK